MSVPVVFQPPVGIRNVQRPVSAACTVCLWSESEPSESEDMQAELLRKATAHGLDCWHPVTITTCSVLTITPLPRQGPR